MVEVGWRETVRGKNGKKRYEGLVVEDGAVVWACGHRHTRVRSAKWCGQWAVWHAQFDTTAREGGALTNGEL